MRNSPTSLPRSSRRRRVWQVFPATPFSANPRPVLWLALPWLVLGLCGTAPAAEEIEAVEKRLADSVRYLASDELEGRGIGTDGIDLAADYIARQFTQLGLKTELFDGTPMQEFFLITSAEMGANNELRLIGPPRTDGGGPETIELKLGQGFSPMAVSGSGEFGLPLVFAGYGITGKQEGYDDYAGLDVGGKAVIVLRHEPQQADPKSVFNGTQDSDHAPFSRKLSNAYEHGAAAVIFCTDRFEIRKNVQRYRQQWQRALDRLSDEGAKLKGAEDPTLEEIEVQRTQIDQLLRQVQSSSERLRAAYDPVMEFRATGGGDSPRDFPVVFCRRSELDRVVSAALGVDLAKLEEQIDKGPQPHSGELTGWRVAGRTDVRRKRAEVKNVVAVLEGEGPLAEETIVVGAHYDHLGRGKRGSQTSAKGEIYNGADDNASGVAALIEIARTLANRPQRLRRRVVFIAFTGEERGLRGSAHYVSHPLVPLEKTVAMLNLDMVGRLRDDKLIVFGSGTAVGFAELIDRINRPYGLKLKMMPSGFGPSDHTSFYAKKIPVMHFFTDRHGDLHRPSDDFETLNIAGMRRVSEFAGEMAVALANAEDRPRYVAVARPPSRRAHGPRPYLGTVPDFGAEGVGYALGSVVEGGPAARAGLGAGDVIIEFGDSKIGSLEDIDSALRKHKSGDRVRVVVRRGKERLTFEVTLDPPR